jgi:alpha-galactosidase
MIKQTRTIRVATIEFLFSVETKGDVEPTLRLEAVPVADLADTHLVRLAVEAPDQQSFAITDLSVEWTVPVVDMHGLYFGGNPTTELAHLPFWKRTKQIASNNGFPYISLIHRSGNSRAAFGFFDQLTETMLSAELRESTRCYHFRLQKPSNKDSNGQTIPAHGRWEEVMFVSTAQQWWPEVLKDYVRLVDEETKLPKMPVPEFAYDPVFCTWTAIHHDVSHEWVMRNAPLAAELGFKTWLTDDGWFTGKAKFANYQYVGDWEPFAPKFPDFKAHVNAVQALGFRYVLWIAPFMIGKSSEAAKRYANLLTTGREALEMENLSVWHAETREIIRDLCERLVRDYDLDGLKIDFLDSVPVDSKRIEGADAETLGASFFNTMQAAIEPLIEQNPGFLVEFRNPYANLASRAYGNIYRSSDVPMNFLLNRWQAALLRLLVPDRAVHLDPAIWHPNDSDENVAVHLINLIVSVPMVSVELDEYPKSHLDLIRYWIAFYDAHRDAIVHGDFKPVIRQAHIPAIYFTGKTETIVGLYEDVPISLDGVKDNVWILNASTRPCVDLSTPTIVGTRKTITRDKFGRVVTEQNMEFPAAELAVEVGGSIEIKASL